MTAAGVNPIDYFNKYPNRFRLCHVKDLTKSAQGGVESCVVGKGTIDFKNILNAGAAKGLKYFIAKMNQVDLNCYQHKKLIQLFCD